MTVELYLAYDGSIHGEWVARYAMRMAAGIASRRLHLVHVDDHSQAAGRLDNSLARLDAECRALDVELVAQVVPMAREVFSTLLSAVPAGECVWCVCGARATSRGRGILTGTVSQRLLRILRFNTLALRVVNPGVLGCPAAVMFPLAGHPRRFQAAMPVLELLSPCLRRLILLRVMTVNALLLRYLPNTMVNRLRRDGRDYLEAVIDELPATTVEGQLQVDDQVQVSDDWAKEIVVQAGKTRASLLLIGASDRFLRNWFSSGRRIERILRNSPCDVGIYRRI